MTRDRFLRFLLRSPGGTGSHRRAYVHRAVLGVVALLSALLIFPDAASAEAPAEYREALAETVRAAEDALSALPPGLSLADHPLLESALSRLESIERVSTEAGVAVTVDNGALIKLLRGNRDEGRQAHESLRQLLAAMDLSLERPGWARGVEVRASLGKVLQRPEFGKSPGNPISETLEGLRTRLFRWLEDLSSRARSLLPDVKIPLVPAGISGAAALGVLVLLGGALVVFTVVFFALTWRSARLNVARHAALRQTRVAEKEDARTARLAAQQAADAGDYRRAIHYLYLWAALHLAERSHTRYDSSLTNREQLRTLAVGGEVTELMHTTVNAFDLIWYGHAACTRSEYTHFRATVERIVGAPA